MTAWIPAQAFGPDYEPDPPLTLVPKRHRVTLSLLTGDRWIGSRDGGPPGNTQDALARLGVAETRWVTKPYAHQEARLTPLGVRYVEAHREDCTRREPSRALARDDEIRQPGFGSIRARTDAGQSNRGGA